MDKTQYVVLTTLLTVIFAAWAYLYYLHWQMMSQPMAAMQMPPSTLSQWKLVDFALIFIMWAIMMAAMMLPSAIPMIIYFSQVSGQRLAKPYPAIFLFVFSYFSVWLLFSIILTLLQWQLHGLDLLTPMMNNQSPLFAAGIFLAAGIYQFVPVKNSCLQHCQSPIGFLLNHWQEGAKGAFNMGFKHGMHCVGCCWAQMMIMFAVGVMNLAAMALITLLVLVEKLVVVRSRLISRGIGIVFLLWGTWILIAEYNC